jgi:mitogen-activated protein kinase organizer 1
MGFAVFLFYFFIFVRARTFSPIQALSDFKDGVTSICVTDSEIIAGSSDGNIRTYDIRAGILQTDTIGSLIFFLGN